MSSLHRFLRRITCGLTLLAWARAATAPPPTNRLIHEKSPYLLQHAHNPVDWYPWGPEAFAKALREDKPIFLSIGYSTCHWCHVMERESFEDPEIAREINANFVPIKVDREERPDLDQVYMAFVQATTGSGGWPMTVWLTPDLKPFTGGTYFPPTDQWGRPGLKSLLSQIAAAWKQDRAHLVARAEEIIRALQPAVAAPGASTAPLATGAIAHAYGEFAAAFDPEFGGFGRAPKFPRPATLNFLARVYAATPDSDDGRHAREMALGTLRKMAAGEIHDHLGGGFHRYAVDRFWHVPHFETMLYDQAQLAVAYLDAFQITREPRFEQTARDIPDYVRRAMTAETGGFYSAADADSQPAPGSAERVEGAFYVWTQAEIERVLGAEQAKLFGYVYGVESGGNAPSDPQGEFRNKNILLQRHTVAEAAKEFGRSEAQTGQLLASSRQALFAVRICVRRASWVADLKWSRWVDAAPQCRFVGVLLPAEPEQDDSVEGRIRQKKFF